MRIEPCCLCPKAKDCKTKNKFHSALRGAGIQCTKARLKCSEWADDFKPGTRVRVALTFDTPDDGLRGVWFTGTVMRPDPKKPGKAFVWLDWEGDKQYFKPRCMHPSLAVKRLHLLDEPPIRVCGACHKPANKKNMQDDPCWYCEQEVIEVLYQSP